MITENKYRTVRMTLFGRKYVYALSAIDLREEKYTLYVYIFDQKSARWSSAGNCNFVRNMLSEMMPCHISDNPEYNEDYTRITEGDMEDSEFTDLSYSGVSAVFNAFMLCLGDLDVLEKLERELDEDQRAGEWNVLEDYWQVSRFAGKLKVKTIITETNNG